MLDVLELDAEVEHRGHRLAEAEAELEVARAMALRIRAEGLFDRLDGLAAMPRSAQLLRHALSRQSPRHKVIGALLPNEEPPTERLDGRVLWSHEHQARVFLLGEDGEVRTWRGVAEDSMGLNVAHGTLRPGVWLGLPGSSMLADLRTHWWAESKATTADDLLYVPRPTAAKDQAPGERHQHGEHGQETLSVAAQLRVRLEEEVRAALRQQELGMARRMDRLTRMRGSAGR